MVTAPLAWIALASVLPLPRSQDSTPSSATRLEFHRSPGIDLYFHVRAWSAKTEAPPLASSAAAVQAARELDRELGGQSLAWGPAEGLLGGCVTAADIARAFDGLPENLELRGGASVRLRAGATKLATALAQAEPAFLNEPGPEGQGPLWKQHDQAVGAALALWEKNVTPKERELLAFHLESLGMEDPQLVVPVYLTAEGPWPGAVTQLDDQGRGVCFVAVEGLEGSQLYETVLHEATHAFDVAAGDASVLGRLRKKLEAAGLSRRDRAMRDVPHTLMFVQAAESIRRSVASEHRDYGVVSGYYSRVPTAEIVRGFWSDHLAGKLELEEALDGIVASVAGPK